MPNQRLVKRVTDIDLTCKYLKAAIKSLVVMVSLDHFSKYLLIIIVSSLHHHLTLLTASCNISSLVRAGGLYCVI